MSGQLSEFHLLRTVSAKGVYPNVLIVCDDVVTDAVVARVARLSARPLQCCGPQNWRLPADSGGTLIVRDLMSLTEAQQSALFEWMTVHGSGTQVISVARPGQHARVASGAFMEALFFRLNIMQLEISCPRTEWGGRLPMAG